MVVNGDVTQIDLPAGRRSGLLDAIDVLKGVEGISFVKFDERDVVRHALVQRIVKAYERYNETTGAGRQMSLKLTDSPLDTPAEASPAPLETASSTSPVTLAQPLVAVDTVAPVLNA